MAAKNRTRISRLRCKYVSAISGFLLLSMLIGLFFAYRDRNKTSTDNYFLAGRNSHPLTIGLSLSASYMSSFALIAVPAEAYLIGTAFVWNVPCFCVAALFAAVYVVPVFHRLNLPSVYEYLELRYNATSRRLGSMMIIVTMLIFAGMNIYLPALALNAVAPVPLHFSIIATSVICTFYTSLGGMKAVIWTDVLQITVMTIGMISVCARTLVDIGGTQNLTDALDRGDRLTAGRIDFNISSRMSPMAIFTSLLLTYTYLFCFTQPFVQRYQSCKTVNGARWALAVCGPMNSVILLLATVNGWLMYAYFEGCDPIKSGELKSYDQVMPFVAWQVFRSFPGLAGLFIAAAFSASLSTVSSILNSLAVVVIEDVIAIKIPNMSERFKIIAGKVIVLVLGTVSMVVAYCFSLLKSNIMKPFVSITASLNGPMLGVFLLGLFMPWISAIGAVSGVVSSFGLMVFMSVGSSFFKKSPYRLPLPLYTDRCPAQNYSTSTTGYVTSTLSSPPTDIIVHDSYETSQTFDQMIYSVSFLNYPVLAVSVTFVVALVVSLITGKNSPSTMNPRLFVPLIESKIFPQRLLTFFRFGVPEICDVKPDGVEDYPYSAASV